MLPRKGGKTEQLSNTRYESTKNFETPFVTRVKCGRGVRKTKFRDSRTKADVIDLTTRMLHCENNRYTVVSVIVLSVFSSFSYFMVNRFDIPQNRKCTLGTLNDSAP